MKKLIIIAAMLIALSACKPTSPAPAAQHYFPPYTLAVTAEQSNGRVDTCLLLEQIPTSFDTANFTISAAQPLWFIADSYPDTVFINTRFYYTDGSGTAKVSYMWHNQPTPLNIQAKPLITDNLGRKWVVVNSK